MLVRISEVLEGKNCYQAVQIYIATFNKASITTEMFLHPTSKNTIIPYKQMIDIGFFNPLLNAQRLAFAEVVIAHNDAICTGTYGG